MKEQSSETYYTESDLHEAFDMGLDIALFVLERIVGFNYDDQIEILDEVRSQLEERKINYQKKAYNLNP